MQTKAYSPVELLPLYELEDARRENGKLVASVSYPLGQVLAETATPGTFAKYTGALGQVASRLLPQAVVTDAAGLITFGSGALTNYTQESVALYYRGGPFPRAEIVGLDAAAEASLARQGITFTNDPAAHP